MKIPQDIVKVLNNKEYFDVLYLKELKRNKGKKQAFESVLERIQEYAPHFVMYVDFDSYKAMYYRRTTNDEDTLIDVPNEVVDAVTVGIDEMMHEYLKKVGVRKHAYDLTVKEINKYFPDYKPYKNYQSYKSSISLAHKRKKR